ncbi:MAG: BadF/BadG/BcrA/BcrD ATPase family protein [Alphaproteobacteria bacterium]
MAEAYHVAVDGGATGTRLLLAAADGTRLARVETGPTSLTLRGPGAWRDIAAACECLRAEAGLAELSPARVGIGLGLAGANNPALRDAFLAAAPPFARVTLATDAHTACLGAHGGAPGCVLIAGTGSVGYRLRGDGSGRLAGGWGFPAGDGGSGARLGLAAVGQALVGVDSGAPSALDRAVWDALGGSRGAALDWLHGASSTRFATLAPLVLAAAAAGDVDAVALAQEAGNALAALATMLDPLGEAPLALVGGIAAPLRPFLPHGFAARLATPRGDALAGALLLARGSAPPENIVTAS